MEVKVQPWLSKHGASYAAVGCVHQQEESMMTANCVKLVIELFSLQGWLMCTLSDTSQLAEQHILQQREH